MLSVIVIILAPFVSQAHANKQTDKVLDNTVDSFIDRALGASPLHQRYLDETTLAKPSPHYTMASPTISTSHTHPSIAMRMQSRSVRPGGAPSATQSARDVPVLVEKSSADATLVQRRAMALAMGIGLAMPSATFAALNNKVGSADAVDDIFAKLEAKRKAAGEEVVSVEDKFKAGGGACGDGYELVVVKVTGAKCVCVSESCQTDKSRKGPSDAERAGYSTPTGKQSAGGVVLEFKNR